jgi:hypothetical protein
MASKKVTIKGRGPELFGRGIDLLFGDTAGDGETELAGNGSFAMRTELNGTSKELAFLDHFAVPADPAREQSYLDVNVVKQPASGAVDEYLRLAAEVFFSTYHMLLSANGATDSALPAAIVSTPQESSVTTEEPVSPELTTAPIHEQQAAETLAATPWTEPPISGLTPSAPMQPYHEGNIMPTSSPEDLVDVTEAAPQDNQPEAAHIRRVGVPPSNGHAGGADSALSPDIVLREGVTLTEQQAQEILSKLRRRDLNALDREVDALYEKAATLLSGDRQEATVAFDILRRVRLILLKEPEQYATAEYLVNQVRARINQIEQSLAGGRAYGPRIFAYQTIWMVILSALALTTTVNGTSFSAWVAYFLGVPMNSEQLNWAVLFISTLAWGGIGGVTSALWSLYHHVSVARDYDPVENLWYYSQPVLGMVLGGIVFLVMGAGFLVVQVDLAAQEAALGARMLPAAIAVVAGFRQNMVLDLIERIISVILPSRQSDSSSLQSAGEQPREESMI